MCILFIVNLSINSGYYAYQMIDLYQILFLVLFVNTDFPPALNGLLYGFTYAHSLFLPQIFASQSTNTAANKISNKFGFIVGDLNFLRNTSHYLLITIVAVVIFSVLKIFVLLYQRFAIRHDQKSNKISNLPE